MSGKLHIPGVSGNTTLCGRQLNNHRSARAQDAANATVATSLQQYLDALAQRKACRHCGRVAGILPKLVRVTRNTDSDEGDNSDE